MTKNYKALYQKFIQAHDGWLHLAAHSHHYWPDVTLAATEMAWMDAAKLVDHKWNYIFSEVIPKTQTLIAKNLSIKTPARLALAPNTHELITRLIFTLKEKKSKLKILTSNSEFYSFERQIMRLENAGLVEVTRIKADDQESYNTFDKNIVNELKQNTYDLVFFSHVFFNTGFALQPVQLKHIFSHIDFNQTACCLDTYHSFCALPMALGEYEHQIFITGGGYKYAQAGEGVCFLSVPDKKYEPLITGWFASFKDLDDQKQKMDYLPLGQAFMGATLDPTPFYRFNAVWEQFQKLDIDIHFIHSYVQQLQSEFLAKLQKHRPEIFKSAQILIQNIKNHGHFITFQYPDNQQMKAAIDWLESRKVLVDGRGRNLRIGFGLYHDHTDIDLLFQKLL